jgi:hypothetical protein
LFPILRSVGDGSKTHNLREKYKEQYKMERSLLSLMSEYLHGDKDTKRTSAKRKKEEDAFGNAQGLSLG